MANDYLVGASRSKKTVIFLVIVAAAAILGFYFWQKSGFQPSLSESWRLVPEKVSQSASIAISLPFAADKNLAQQNVKIEPAIEGDWVSSESEKIIVFKPKEKLKLNNHYSIQLALAETENKTIVADFLAVEDPEITAIFPSEGSEAPEKSEITIVFNRPIVPLTTLGYLEKKDIPVSISPQTPGRFKWTSTNNLQFIPEVRLVRSSNYKVTVKPGFVSGEGLGVEGKALNFTTRHLRYLDLTSGSIAYNQPLTVFFNQPVDLNKTKGEMVLRNEGTGKEVAFSARYKDSKEGASLIGGFLRGLLKRFGLDSGSEEQKQGEEKSAIEIFLQRDKFGRSDFWDFNNNYSLEIKRAYPLEGDIALEESRIARVAVSGLIKTIRGESTRTSDASLDFFDPEGKLWLDFYEEIDLGKSRITSPKLKEVGYGEKCREGTIAISSQVECEKVQDRSKVYLVFKSAEMGIGEKLDISLERIVNVDGLNVGGDPAQLTAQVYPEFRILRSIPGNSFSGASLTRLVLCSNSPILTPDRKDFGAHLESNLDYQIDYWPRSFRTTFYRGAEGCELGQFTTDISLGFMPQSDYQLNLKLDDVFGQKANYPLSFRTGNMPSQQLAFFGMQDPYSVTSPSKTKLTFAAKNMEYVNLEICQLPAYNLLSYLDKRPGVFDDPGLIRPNCQKITQDQIDLPSKFWVNNYFKVDLADYFPNPLGHYVLTFSHPNYTLTDYYYDGIRYQPIQRQAFQRSFLTVTNLAVAEKDISAVSLNQPYGLDQTLDQEQLSRLNNLYWVTDINSLAPVSGAAVSLYQGEAKSFSASYVTNAEGLAETRALIDSSGVVVSKGLDSTVLPRYQSNVSFAASAFSAAKIYLYTDKPIYQPGQEVFFKGIYRLGYDADYEIPQGRINLRVFNPRNDEILNQDLAVSNFGTFDAKTILPADSPLGSYRVCIKETFYSCAFFDIQEYVPAAFAVEAKTDKEEYVSKDTVNLEVKANYYFGVPLEGGRVDYTFSSQDYYFDRYQGGYLAFGGIPSFDQFRQERFLLRGETQLNGKGEAKISQELDFGKLFKNEEGGPSKIIVADITVRNNQGQTVSSQKSFIVHAGEFYLGLSSDKRFLAKDEDFNLNVRSLDIQGKEARVGGIGLNLFKVEWAYSQRQEATGGFSYKWEKRRSLAQTFDKFGTDANGNYSQKIKIPEEGSYEAEVQALDRRGNKILSVISLYIFGEKEVSVRPTTGTLLELEAEKTQLEAGEQGKIIIKSPYPEAKALISLERGRIFDYQVKTIKGNLAEFSFEAKDEYAPNIFVSVLLQSSKPEVKFGQAEFKINVRQKELGIIVKPNKANYLPGEEVSLDILTKNAKGEAVSAETSLAVVDLSVLALKGNPKKDPVIFFYGGFPLTVSTASNLRNILIEYEIPTKGGGGGTPSELARKKRGEFKETAFWQAVVRTDQNGRARVTFTLPDNLTTWQAETVGVTQDTKLGVAYNEFLTKKELMVVPLRPRFVVPGDIFQVGGQIFNQSQAAQRVTLKFESSTLKTLNDKSEKEIMLQPGKTITLYFNVQAPNLPNSGEHRFVLSGTSRDLEDVVEQSIKITPNNAYESVATANSTPQSLAQEYVFLPPEVVRDKGSLTVKTSATLAVFLSDALNYLLQFPYGCSEQIASRLNAVAIVKRGLNLPNLEDKFKLEKIKFQDREYTINEVVELGLAELAKNQTASGGFSYWGFGEPNFYLTLQIVEALQNLALAGFNINQDSLNRASQYVYSEIGNNEDLYRDKNTVVLAASALYRLPVFSSNAVLRQRINEISNDDLFLQDLASNAALAKLALILNNGTFGARLENKVNEALDNRLEIDSRGAFLSSNKNILWQDYETPIKNTALYLKALSQDQRELPILDKVLRWLLNSRAKDGAWGSTNNTLQVIDALTDFLRWKRETESSFSLELRINDGSLGSFDFNPQTILEQFRKEVVLSELRFNELNTVSLAKTNNNNLTNNLYYDLSLKYYLPLSQIAPRDEGFTVERNIYGLEDKENKNPLREARVGDVLKVNLKVTVPEDRNFVMLEDFIPAGFEIANLDLATEQKSLLLRESELSGREFQPDFKELRDDRAFLFKERVSPGVYEFEYFIRALIRGKFSQLPFTASEMYFPENFGRTSAGIFEIR